MCIYVCAHVCLLFSPHLSPSPHSNSTRMHSGKFRVSLSKDDCVVVQASVSEILPLLRIFLIDPAFFLKVHVNPLLASRQTSAPPMFTYTPHTHTLSLSVSLFLVFLSCLSIIIILHYSAPNLFTFVVFLLPLSPCAHAVCGI